MNKQIFDSILADYYKLCRKHMAQPEDDKSYIQEMIAFAEKYNCGFAADLTLAFSQNREELLQTKTPETKVS